MSNEERRNEKEVIMDWNDTVTITCYGKTEKRKRQEAIRFYTEGMIACAGSSEGDRYLSIVTGLNLGRLEVDDLWQWK